MDWLDYFGWWMGKFDECEQHLKVITREQWIDLLDAYDAADDAWQAAFDGVLAGVDEEIVRYVRTACYGDRWAHPLVLSGGVDIGESYNLAILELFGLESGDCEAG